MGGSKDIAFDSSKASVLITDGNVLCMEVLCMEVLCAILAGFGFRKMHRCTDFDAAKQIVRRHAVDLMFIEPFPYKEGAYDFVRWIRSERLGASSNATIFLTSANAHVKLISKARDCGVDYVVAKPFATATIIDRIAWVVENGGRRGELIAPAELVTTEGSGVDLW